MQIIAVGKIRAAAKLFSPEVQKSVEAWILIARNSTWTDLADIRIKYSRSVDLVGNFLVFNLAKGHRLIVGPDFRKGRLYFKYLLSHVEYNTDKWKDDDYF